MDNPYTTLQKKNVQNELLLTDKLTAFDPHTTGIPLGQNKELEIMKQLYDVATLTELLVNQKEL